MFRSRVLALEDMARRGAVWEEQVHTLSLCTLPLSSVHQHSILPLPSQEAMRSKLAHEGWQADPSFPAGWLLKKWEGKTRTRGGKLNQDLKFLSRAGGRLESFKAVLEALGHPPYTAADREKVKEFKDRWSVNQRVTGFEWEPCEVSIFLLLLIFPHPSHISSSFSYFLILLFPYSSPISLYFSYFLLLPLFPYPSPVSSSFFYFLILLLFLYPPPISLSFSYFLILLLFPNPSPISLSF
jgi:hypothetical protein